MAPSGSEPALEVALRDVAWVSALARRLAHDGEAEDLAQDTWLAALEAPGRARDGLRQWLSGVARFLAVRRRRRARPEPSDALDSRPGDGLTDELVQQTEFQERVLAAVRALAEPYRVTVLLRYYEGLAFEEVARRTGVPASTARTRLARAHEQLRARLDRECGGRAAWAILVRPATKSPIEVGAGGTVVKWAATACVILLVGWVGFWRLGSIDPREQKRADSPVARGELDPLLSESSVEAALLPEPEPGPRRALSAEPRRDLEEGPTVAESREDPGLVLAGRVIDEQGTPIAGVQVKAVAPEAMSWAGTHLLETDEDGRFELNGLERRDWKLIASRVDVAWWSELLVEGDAGDVLDLEFVMQLGSCLAGTVSWLDGKPVDSFTVTASSGTGSMMASTHERFELCGLADQAWDLRVEAVFHRERAFTELKGVRPGGAPLDIRLECRRTFELPILVRGPTGDPIDDFRVEAGGEAGRARIEREDGRAQLAGLLPGSWKLEIQAAGHLEKSVELVLDVGSSPLEFVLEEAPRLHGLVLDEFGKGVDGALVTERDGRTATTGADGRFVIETGRDTPRLWAKKAGHGPSETLEVMTSTRTSPDEIVLRLRPACRLSGRVLDSSGRPAASVWVGLQPPARCESVGTDSDGAFVLLDLAPGDAVVWALPVDDRGEARTNVTLVSGASNTVELRLAPEGEVSGN